MERKYVSAVPILKILKPEKEKEADISICSTAQCSRYLCPNTLACVHFPHHCPCPHPDVEDKIELGEGSAICVSRGGYKPGEANKKVELARKGLL